MPTQRFYLTGAFLLLLLLTRQTIVHQSAIALIVIGLLLGLAFHHAGFGFSGAYRVLMEIGSVRLIRAQLLLLGLTTLLFAPFLAVGSFRAYPVVTDKHYR